MTDAIRAANSLLAEIIAAAGCSHAGLARRVNTLGSKQGLALNYDKTAVSHWLSGTQPRAIVRYLVAEALAEKLGRPVTLAELGFAEPEAPGAASRALAFHDPTSPAPDVLLELGMMDLNRRSLLKLVPFISGALLGPQRDWLLSLAETPTGTSQERAVEAGSPAVGVRAMVGVFDEMDNRYGGGHARVAALHYLTGELLPMLNRPYPERARRDLFTAAAKLTAQIGWMTYDVAGGFGLAQRYMTQALRLCDEGQDRVLAGQIFAGMSHLATTVGSAREALNLARVGATTAANVGSPLGLMRIYAMRARAHAALCEPRGVTDSLRQAERALAASRGPDNESEWVRYLDRAYLASESAACFRDLGEHHNAEDFAVAAINGTKAFGRRHTLSLTVLASAQLQRKDADLHGAIDTAKSALRQLDAVSSRRGVLAIRDFQSKLAPHRTEAAVRAFEAEINVKIGAA